MTTTPYRPKINWLEQLRIIFWGAILHILTPPSPEFEKEKQEREMAKYFMRHYGIGRGPHALDARSVHFMDIRPRYDAKGRYIPPNPVMKWDR